MSKHYEKLDVRLASIDGSLAAIAKVFVLVVETGLFDKLLAALPDAAKPLDSTGSTIGPDANSSERLAGPAVQRPDDDVYCVTESEIQAGLWMARKESWIYLCTVKSTLERMIEAGELKKCHRVGDRGKRRPRVWLRRSEVEKHFGDYTLFKGKERKKP